MSPGDDRSRPGDKAAPNVDSTDRSSFSQAADTDRQPLRTWRSAFVWMQCRICGQTAEVTQERLDEIIRTRPGTSDLCNVCYAKYGEWEVA